MMISPPPGTREAESDSRKTMHLSPQMIGSSVNKDRGIGLWIGESCLDII